MSSGNLVLPLNRAYEHDFPEVERFVPPSPNTVMTSKKNVLALGITYAKMMRQCEVISSNVSLQII